MFHAHNFFPSFLVRNGVKEPLRNVQMDAFKNPPVERDGIGVAEVAVDYAPELITQDALRFIRESKDNPFFLYYALNIPHANNEGGRYDRGMEVPDLGEFVDEPWPLAEKGFATMIKRIDDDVAKLLDLLQELGIDDNTIVLFSSDNGPHQEGNHRMEFFDSNGEKRGMKRDLYEGGVRVPLIVRWPSKITPGRVIEEVTAFQDLMPTVCDLIDVKSPRTDGVSMLPLLLGKKAKEKERDLYWEFGEKGGKQAVLQGDWKLIRLGLENPVYELYNVVTDVSEQRNVAVEHPEKVQSLKRLLKSIPDDQSAFN